MQFRLTYRGKLPAATRNDSRAKEKQYIRRVFRGQLAELWRTHPFLNRFLQAHVREVRFTPEKVNARTIEEARAQMVHTEYDDFTVADKMSRRFPISEFRFLPLVGSIFSGVETACAIDILFLRRDAPGKIVSGGGDIDNRLKTLMDALKMPKTGELSSRETLMEGDNPFFCLVEDDSLITEIKVTTDRLLTPLGDGEHENEVSLVIHVRTELIGLSGGADMGAATAFMTQVLEFFTTRAAAELGAAPDFGPCLIGLLSRLSRGSKPVSLGRQTAEHRVMQWTDASFDEMSWHDNHVHGIQVGVDNPDHGTGTLTLDLDHILEWIPPSSSGEPFRFRIAPALLTFHEVSSLRIEIDWAAVSAGMTPFSIGEIARRKLEYGNEYTSWAWTIEVNWPKGAITFDAPRFTQQLTGAVIDSGEQCLTAQQRPAA